MREVRDSKRNCGKETEGKSKRGEIEGEKQYIRDIGRFGSINLRKETVGRRYGRRDKGGETEGRKREER